MAADAGTSESVDVLAVIERQISARESQRCDELLQSNRELSRVVEGLREENAALLAKLGVSYDAGSGPRTIDQTARQFYSLAAVWKTMTLHVSNVTEKCSHPAYTQIIAMGPGALPFIFKELEREPDNWFVALRALTGTNPVPVNSRYSFEETVSTWLNWAEQHGYYRRPDAEN